MGCLALGYALLVSNPLLTASSLPAIALEYLEWDDEPESKDAQEGRPLPHPQQVLLHALTCLNNDDW